MSDDDQRRYREQAARTGARSSGKPDSVDEPVPDAAKTDHPAGESQAKKNVENESPG